MKKRIALALAAIMAISMFSACGSDDVSDEPETEEARPKKTKKTKKTTTADESDPEEITADGAITVTAESDPAEPDNNAPAETTTAETTTAAPEEPAAPVELPTITNVRNIYRGDKKIQNDTIAFVADGKNYVYNTKTNEIYETECSLDDMWGFCGRILLGKKFIVNLKTGERFDLDEDYDYFYNNANDSDYICMKKTEQAFSGNTVYLGVLNSDGEWAMPMSSDYAICADDGSYFKSMEDKGRFNYKSGAYEDGVLQNDKVLCTAGMDHSFYQYSFYDKAKDEFTVLDPSDNYSVYDITEDNIILLEDPDGFSYQASTTVYSLYKYDINTGEKTFIVEIPDGMTLPYRYDGKIRFYYAIKDKAVKLFDPNYDFIAEYDLSEYDFYGGIYNADENTIVFQAYGADGGEYVVIMNKDGSFVCEPLLTSSNKSEMLQGGYFSENKIVFYYYEGGGSFSIDRKTGERTDFSDKFDFMDYDENNDLMIVQKDNAYYMVDPENPDKLISPFEIAKLMN